MRIAIPGERAPGERRVAMVPDVATRLVQAGHTVSIEANAGRFAFYSDELYEQKGAHIVHDIAELFEDADLICKVAPPTPDEVRLYGGSSASLSFFQPQAQRASLDAFVQQKITAFSFDLLPRISRAQAMDALSSQATVSGYRSVLLAADRLGRFFPMFMTAAGTVPPARVVVLGAGVAGLQAIATARRLGASVRAHDIRPSSREEIRSLGATFIEVELATGEEAGGYAREQSAEYLARQRELIGNEIAQANVVITTAAVPGRRAPLLVSAEMVNAMAPGSVIVDLAAETGGNCELTRPGEEIDHAGVLIVGVCNLASSMPTHASFLFARNVAEFVSLLSKDGQAVVDFEDEILAGMCVTYEGAIREDKLALLGEGGHS